MPFSYRFYPAQSLTLARMDGIVTFDEVIAAAREMVADPGYSPLFHMVLDLRGLGQMQADPVGIMGLMAQLTDYFPAQGQDQLVIYIAGDGLQQRLAQMIGKSVGALPGFHASIVHDWQQALDILGIADLAAPGTHG